MDEKDDGEPSPAAQLCLRAGGQVHRLTTIGRRPILVGRDAGADVIIQDPAVSRHHALIWCAGPAVFVRDLGSALGTRVGSRTLSPGDAHAVDAAEPIVLARRVTLYWEEAGARPVDPPAVAIVTPPGRIADPLGLDTTTLPMDDGGLIGVTVSCLPSGPREVRLEDDRGNELRIRGESRVVMLYLLAEQAERARQGLAASAWVDDRKLAIGLWGAKGPELPTSRLNTVISRVRGQLRDSLFPADLIQKDAGRTRLGPCHGAIVIERRI